MSQPAKRAFAEAWVFWERGYPFILGCAASLAWILAGDKLAVLAESKSWHFDQVYTAAFGFLAVSTGYLASFYGTIQTMAAGFIERIRDTHALSTFIVFIKRGIILGFVATIASMPMMVVAPIPTVRYSPEAVAVAAWLGVVVWALASFYRVASLLFFLFEVKPPKDRPGG